VGLDMEGLERKRVVVSIQGRRRAVWRERTTKIDEPIEKGRELLESCSDYCNCRFLALSWNAVNWKW